MRFRIGVLLTVALSYSCSNYKPGSALRPSFNSYTPEQDVEIGRQAAEQVRKQVKIHPNGDVQGYVEGLGRKLSSADAAGRYPYSFTVIQEQSINAFALPGGPVFIHSGLLKAADNESQLAGVMAHEISHVALRHGTSQASKANLLQIPAALAGAVLGSGAGAEVGRLGMSLALQGVLLKYSRTAESEADALGARIMSQAGYNPIEMARFFQKLEQGGDSRAPEFLSDHPNPGNRVKAVEAELRAMPRREYQADRGGFERIKQLALSNTPRRGVFAFLRFGE